MEASDARFHVDGLLGLLEELRGNEFIKYRYNRDSDWLNDPGLKKEEVDS